MSGDLRTSGIKTWGLWKTCEQRGGVRHEIFWEELGDSIPKQP